MTRMLKRVRWIGVIVAGGALFTGGCLPADFYSQLFASAITTAVTTVVANVAAGLVPAGT